MKKQKNKIIKQNSSVSSILERTENSVTKDFLTTASDYNQDKNYISDFDREVKKIAEKRKNKK